MVFGNHNWDEHKILISIHFLYPGSSFVYAIYFVFITLYGYLTLHVLMFYFLSRQMGHPGLELTPHELLYTTLGCIMVE